MSLPLVREPPAVDATLCANARHAGTGCTRCSDVCPASAFDQSGPAAVPRIDDAACLGCGACIPVCPLDAIGDVRPGRDMSAAVADLPPGAIVLVCRPRRGAEVTAPGHVIDHSRCLAALAPEDLLELAGDEPRDLWLDDGRCAGCALAVLHGRIADTASDANLLARTFGRPAVVHLVSATGPDPGPVPPAGGWRDARGGVLSRRRLLGGMVRPATRGPTGVERPATTGRRRRLLSRLEAWERSRHLTARTDQQVAGSTGLRVDTGRCSACELCARFCPTDALTFVAGAEEGIEQAFELRFRPALCVACHVCEAACPEHALALDARVDVVVDDAVTQVVAAGGLGHCTACGSTTLAGRSRCFSCANAVVTSTRDEAGLMADLLARAPAPPS